ncbi:MAG: HYR domain-containing protein [Chitinophagaceae bacterium]
MKFLVMLSFTILFVLAAKKGSTQTCTLSCPSNIVAKADSGKEGTIVSFPSVTSAGDCGTITYSPASGSFFRLGSHSIIATTSSGQKCYFTITVTDNEPPVVSELNLSLKKLWPASNKMKKVAVYYTAKDNGQDVNSVLTVSSNAQDSTTRDWEIIDNHLIRLKASRLPNGEVRIYTITVTSTDDAGNITRRTTSIAVSKTMTARPLVKN